MRRLSLLVISCWLWIVAVGGTADEPKATQQFDSPLRDTRPANDKMNESDSQPPANPADAPNPANAAKPAKTSELFNRIAEFIGEFAVEIVQPGDAGELRQIRQQFLQQLRHLLSTEMRFVQTMCQPTPLQFTTIESAGEAGVNEVLKRLMNEQRAERLRQARVFGHEKAESVDPRQSIVARVAQSVRETLPPEVAKAYAAELDKRAAARKRVMLLNLVARLDKNLILTVKQRDELMNSLAAHWSDAWVPQLEVFLYDDSFVPELPDDKVLPFLNERQKLIWQAIPKRPNGFLDWPGAAFLQMVPIDDAIPADLEPAGAKQGEAQP